jgi:hypothetical protein
MMIRPSSRSHFDLVAILLFFALVLFPGQLSWAEEHVQAATELPVSKNLPFKPGERFVYDLHWGVIPAGQAELRVLPMVEVDGVPAWHFQLTARSNDFIDVFYKVRDQIDAYAVLSLEESLLYRQSQQEGTTRREVEVNFDLDRSQATFTNYGEALPPINIAAGTLDPLTALYFIRSQPLCENLEIVRPISDGKKNVNGVAEVMKREEIRLNDTIYDTFQIEPDLKGVKGVFEKSNKSRMTLWVTTDERRMVVKIKSRVVVGSFTGTLVNNP